MIMIQEIKIGEVFEYNGIKLKVRKMSPWGECRKCFFFKEGNVTCGVPKCAAYERKDKNYVYFEKELLQDYSNEECADILKEVISECQSRIENCEEGVYTTN